MGLLVLFVPCHPWPMSTNTCPQFFVPNVLEGCLQNPTAWVRRCAPFRATKTGCWDWDVKKKIRNPRFLLSSHQNGSPTHQSPNSFLRAGRTRSCTTTSPCPPSRWRSTAAPWRSSWRRPRGPTAAATARGGAKRKFEGRGLGWVQNGLGWVGLGNYKRLSRCVRNFETC